MILPFSTQLKGNPTFFPEKILKGCLHEFEENQNRSFQETPDYIYNYGDYSGYASVDCALYSVEQSKAKIHSIREDKKDRWKPKVKIDFFVNTRKPNMFRFAPVVPVVSTQKILITYTSKNQPRIFIDDKIFYVSNFSLAHDYRMLHLANNDGFDTVEEFFAYFNTEFTGKIIHWTEKSY